MTASSGARDPAVSATDLRVLAEAVPHITWIAGPDGSAEYVNRQGTGYAYTSDGVATVSEWAAVIHPADVDPVARAWARAARTKSPFTLDCRLRRFDGAYRWHALRARPIADAVGVVARWIATATDVDDARMLAAELQVATRRAAESGQSYRELSAIVESSGDAIFGARLDGIVTSWNLAAEGLFGYRPDEIIGRSLAVLVPEVNRLEQQQVLVDVAGGGPTRRLDTSGLRKDGTLVDVHITVSPVADEAGNVTGISGIIEDITERVRAQAVVEVSQRRLADAQRIAEVGSFELEVSTGDMVWSAEMFRILGLNPTLAPTAEVFIPMIHPDDQSLLGAAWNEAAERGTVFDLVYRVIRADGQDRWVHARAIPEIAEDGRILKLIGTLRDNTERVEAARAQDAATRRFEAGFEQGGIGAGILTLDGIPMRVNAAACALLGRPAEQLIGQSFAEYTHPDDPPLGAAVSAWMASGHDTYADERRYIRPDGTVVWASLHLTLVRDELGEPEYCLAQLQDICERKAMEAELVHQALHDSLTGLANRTLLTDRLTHALAGTRRRASRLAVTFVDIDAFKVVNDSMGHSAGDDLLRQAAARIAAEIRPGDTLARFGGDEFVIVSEDASPRETEEISERVRTTLSRPFPIASKDVHVTASLGTAVADDGATPESLLADSDAAMYVAKGLGRDRTEMFDNALRFDAERRIAMLSDLRHALERDELAVHYQPVVDLSTGAMTGVEALLRWEHPDRGFVSPVEFIPLAEENSLIIPIGAWVLERACEQLTRWHRMSAAITVAVNLSVRQMLAADIVEVIEDVLRRTGAPPANLCLEVTESVFMKDATYFGAILTRIKALGVKISIDDFGTGYSSLSYLKEFPVDAVKIDRSFVDGLAANAHDSALIAAILAMADALQLEATAEGVENREQLTILKGLRCRRAQGFYLAHPMPHAAIDKLMPESHRWEVD
jgi:diguanylate cyclase (GGDEF)-like protein/PAS domain S-box-containing protein